MSRYRRGVAESTLCWASKQSVDAGLHAVQYWVYSDTVIVTSQCHLADGGGCNTNISPSVWRKCHKNFGTVARRLKLGTGGNRTQMYFC